MLERLIEDTRPGDFALDLHPSANTLFKEDGTLERPLSKVVNLTYDRMYGNLDTSSMSGKEKIARLVGARALIGTMGTAYVLAESLCRGSESVVRGTGKVLKTVGNLAYDKLEFVESITEKVKEGYDTLQQKVSRPIKKKIKRFFQRFKDPLVVGLSVAAVALGYGGIRSCGEEEPTAQVEPAHYEPEQTERLVSSDREEETNWEFYVPDVNVLEAQVEDTEGNGMFARAIDRLTPKPVNGVWPLGRFSNETVLAYCANPLEKDYVIKTLQENNNEVRSIYINPEETRARIVNAHGKEVHLDIRTLGEDIPNKKYDIIALRGHTDDMMPLQGDTESREAKNVIYLLGGCQSAAFIDDLAKPERPVFGVKEGLQGRGPINTYALLRVIDEMDACNTWDEMNGQLRALSPIRITNEFVLPGTAEYQRRLGR